MFQYASLKGIARKHGYDFTIPPKEVFGQHDPLVRGDNLNIYDVFQLDSKNRGFSYKTNCELDMRFDRSQKKSAFDIVMKILVIKGNS